MRHALALTVLLLALVPSVLPAHPAGARPCYRIWAEAVRSDGHFRHLVYVENDCEEWVECSVWTDVNPNPPKIFSVAPGATESAETNGDSKYDDPKAAGTCRLK